MVHSCAYAYHVLFSFLSASYRGGVIPDLALRFYINITSRRSLVVNRIQGTFFFLFSRVVPYLLCHA